MSILRQLFEQWEIRDPLLKLEEAIGKEWKIPSIHELLDIFMMTVPQVRQHIYLVIDAPDNVKDLDIAFIMESFRLMVKKCNHLSLFFTTRHHFVAGGYFNFFTPRRVCISEQKENQDIEIHINLRLQNDKGIANWPPETKEEVSQKLNQDAAGM